MNRPPACNAAACATGITAIQELLLRYSVAPSMSPVDCTVTRSSCTAPHLNLATSGFPHIQALTLAIRGVFADWEALKAFNRVSPNPKPCNV